MTGKPENPPKPIKIGIIGCGAMGRGLLYQSLVTPGIDCAAIADLDLERCTTFLSRLGLPFTVSGDLEAMNHAIENGRIAVTGNGDLIPQCTMIGAVIEATNSISEGGRYAVAALQHQKHLILMNSEIDLIFGPYLVWLANQQHVICTSCDGDQYGVIKHLIDDLESWGFELVMAGNIKGFLDRYANPTSIIAEADKRNLDYRMCTSYTDGTKLNIEMAIIANAHGLVTPIPGMNGPLATHVSEVFQKFDFAGLWRNRKPFVDYILGAEPGGGVFAVGYCEHPYQREMMAYYKMGPGPYYLFYRPYHLCHIEAMSTVTNAVTRNTPLLQPNFGFHTNVYTYAKRDLSQGDILDGIGGYNCYGMIENCADQMARPGLPICLAENIVLNRNIRKDEKIYLDDVIIPPDRFDFTLHEKALRVSNGRTACI
jgi:predicted homoserine dehydrogenase-like protein